MDTDAFLTALYGDIDPAHWWYLWTLSADGETKHSHWFSGPDVDRAVTLVRGSQRCHVYYPLAIAAQRGTVDQRTSTKESGVPPVALLGPVADVDIDKDRTPKTEAEALAFIESWPLRPTYCVHSGHGLQTGHLFKEPWAFPSVAEVQALTYGWAQHVGKLGESRGYHLDSVWDLARVMRVPGSLNVKGEPLPVRVLWFDDDQRYNPADFDPYLLDAPTVAAARAVELGAALPTEKLELLCEADPDFAATWQHDRPTLKDQSCSGYDWELARYAVQAGWSDEEIAALIAENQRRHGNKPGKGQRASYIAPTIAKARTGVTVTPVPAETTEGGGDNVTPPPEPPIRHDMLWTDAAALRTKVAAIRWLWPGWLPFGFITICSAPGGDGKSALALEIAKRVIDGAPQWPDGAPNTTPPTTPVCVIDNEGVQAMWLDRMSKWGMNDADLWFPGDGFAKVKLDNAEALAGIRGTIQDMGIRLLVMDSLRPSLPDSVDENDSRVGSFLAPWADLARDTGVALLLIHHYGKPGKGERGAHVDRLRGSTAIAASARVVWGVDRPQSATRDEDPTMRLSVVKQNLCAFPPPLGFVVTETGVEWCDAPEADRDQRAPARGNAKAFLNVALKHGPVACATLLDSAAEQGISKDALYRARKDLRIVDVPDETDAQRRRRLWSLPAPSHRDSSGWG